MVSILPRGHHTLAAPLALHRPPCRRGVEERPAGSRDGRAHAVPTTAGPGPRRNSPGGGTDTEEGRRSSAVPRVWQSCAGHSRGRAHTAEPHQRLQVWVSFGSRCLWRVPTGARQRGFLPRGAPGNTHFTQGLQTMPGAGHRVGAPSSHLRVQLARSTSAPHSAQSSYLHATH